MIDSLSEVSLAQSAWFEKHKLVSASKLIHHVHKMSAIKIIITMRQKLPTFILQKTNMRESPIKRAQRLKGFVIIRIYQPVLLVN